MERRRLWPLGLAAAVLAPALFGAEVNRSWETLVSTLKPGRTVVVLQHSGKRTEGKVLSLTGESIIVQAGAQPSPIRREEVFRVRAAGIRSRNSLLGLGLGAGAGVAFGSNLGSRRHGLSAAVFGGVFGGIGAAAGAAMPIGNPLYEAPGGLRTTGP
jgi:hypothetical protein